ncbi:MAG: hypothetical protein JXB23_13765 [Candidatus Aminicenantes bacterium]|nr:hypothetical protein [Candidatus Aminicenantes bacterium]
MRKISIYGYLVFLVLCLAVFNYGSGQSPETFLLKGKNLISLSIESYKLKDGWAPVVLSLGEIDFLFWMDVNGQVKERKRMDSPSLFALDAGVQEMIIGGVTIPMEIRSESTARMRLRPLEENVPVAMSIDPKRNRLSFAVGEGMIVLDHLSVAFVGNEKRVQELRLGGPGARMGKRILYSEDTGKLYAARHMNEPLDLSEARVWAEKVK